MTANRDFKGTLFAVEYLRNCTRYGYSGIL